ncbi:double-strand break repair helicase AddA [Desulfovibrio sp.]|uniref:double-strand break repair helicase AddA n=1 Tax=Desulfovibrio sp. TaxID=885 RepID=UPI0025C04AE0|nr:double-strand break repair helicase AddA [Desulfovibrio sp.]
MSVEQLRAADPKVSVWVDASAGAGKTKVLTDRMLRLFLIGTVPARILGLTFTKAAAAEMSNRLRARLGRWATVDNDELFAELLALTGTQPDEEMLSRARGLFNAVLDAPGGLSVLTLHSFCQSVLRRFPIEAGISPRFELLEEREADEILFAARERMLSKARDGADPTLAAGLRDITAYGQEGDFADLMGELARERGRLARLLRKHGDIRGVLTELRRVLGVAETDTLESALAEACADSAFDCANLRAVSSVMLGAEKTDRDNGGKIAAWLSSTVRAAEFDVYRKAFFTTDGSRRAKLCHNATLAAMPAAGAILAEEAGRLERLRERLNSIKVYMATAALLRLGCAVLAEYQKSKNARALLDFDDLILKTCDLLNTREAADWVLYKLDGGIDHILVDEGQDTNPDQWWVIEALAGDFFAGESVRSLIRTVFAVGDTKQSIYSFQRADPAGFERSRALFSERSMAAGMAWDDITLDVSYRSVEAVLQAVDAVFARPAAMAGVSKPSHPVSHHAHRLGHGGLVEVWPLAEKMEKDAPADWEPPVEYRLSYSPEARLAKVMAERIHHWISTGEILESKGRPIQAGDILVLVRRRTSFVDTLVRSLKEYGIPVAGADRMVLTEQIAVMDLMALGRFLLLPEDDLNLAALLKSPLFGLDEDQLFTLCHGRTGSLWRAMLTNAYGDAKVAEVAGELQTLLAEVDFERPYELFARVLNVRGGRQKMLARLGPDASDPLDEFLGLAIAYERSNVPSLQGFLYWLESGRAEIKRDMDQAGREVRIMTVHGAKGLQAPIVFLPDTTQVPTQLSRVLWPAADGVPLWAPRREMEDPVFQAARMLATAARDEEYNRLLYVAMTRAEDRLYVCGWPVGGSTATASWYDLIVDGLSGTASTMQFDLGTGAIGWTGEGLRLITSQTVPVVTMIPATDDARIIVPDFLKQAPAAEPTPAVPLVPSRPNEPDPPARSPFDATDPLLFVRGRLTHRLLQTLPDLPSDQWEAACQRFLSARVHGLDAGAQASIAAEVLAVLHDPAFGPLFGPGSQAEVPIVGLVAGQAMSGQIDRLLVLPQEVRIIDFKSNRPPPLMVRDVSPVYLRQMAAYRAALAAIYPDRPIICALLWTCGARLMELDATLLDQCSPVSAA